jgi:hypothetical protein
MTERRPRSRERRVVDSCRDLAVIRRNGLRLRRKIIQTIAERPKRGLVVPPVRNGACRGLNNGRIFGQRDNPPALQQPDEAWIVVAGGGVVLIATLVGAIHFDLSVMAVAMAAVLGGTVVAGSNRSTVQEATHELTVAEARRTALIEQMDLRLVPDRNGRQ